MNPQLIKGVTNRWGLLAAALTLIALCGAIILVVVPAPHPLDLAQSGATTTPSTTGNASSTASSSGTTASSTSDLSDLVVVTSPKPGATIGTSTLTVTGKARGSFYFEASFPVYLTDWDGRIIAQGHAQAQGDWMTQDFVPFTATLTYTKPVGGAEAVRGTLILRNDNPSGDPARDKALEVPVYFQ